VQILKTAKISCCVLDSVELTAMKASVAAVITILLIAVCVIFDLCNKYRVKQQVKKAVADAVERAENAPEKAKVPLV